MCIDLLKRPSSIILSCSQQVVFTQLNLLGTIGLDSWDGYTANRKRILDLLYKRKIDNTHVDF
jgi:phosphodiesterase/alkaline phosphatase D-like protein